MINPKYVLIPIVLILSSNLYAQVNFGIRGGINFANLNGKVDGDTDDDTKMKTGFNIGVVSNYDFSEILGLETGLVIESKGYEYRFDDDGDLSDKADYGKLVTNLIYLDVPINLKAKKDLGKVQIIGRLGPYIGFALNGKVKATGDLEKDLDDAGLDTEESLEFGGSAEDDNLKRGDIGLMLGAGVGFNLVEIGVGYDIGLANILPGGDSDNFIRNRVLKLYIAYVFKD